MGAKSRRKGREGELQAARALRGKRISETGLGSPDVRDRWSRFWEVKWWGTKFDFLYKILDQNRDQTRGKSLVRGDRQEWIVMMPLATFLTEPCPHCERTWEDDPIDQDGIPYTVD